MLESQESTENKGATGMWRVPKCCSFIIKGNHLGQRLLTIFWFPEVLATTVKCFPSRSTDDPPEKLGRTPGSHPATSQPHSETEGLWWWLRATAKSKSPNHRWLPQASLLATGNGSQHNVICQSELHNWGGLEAMSKYLVPGSGPLMNWSLMTQKQRRKTEWQRHGKIQGCDVVCSQW